MESESKIKRNFVLLLLLLAAAGLTLQARVPQTAGFQFEYLTMVDGLSQSSVNCIVQDSVGFLWFGTQDGLNRYDGYEFRVFKHQPFNDNSLSHNWVHVMIETEPGVLWIGTWAEGLNRFDTLNNEVTRYRHTPGDKTGLSSSSIRALFQDSKSILWVGTTNGLDSLVPGSDTFIHFRHIPEDPTSLSHNEITAIYEAPGGTLWIGTSKGLNRFDRETGRFTPYFHHPNAPRGLSGDNITSITGGPEGNPWIGTLNNGLNLLLPGKEQFIHFKHSAGDPGSLCSNTVKSLMTDSEGYLWVGTGSIETNGSGLSRLNFNEEKNTWEITNFGYRSSRATNSRTSAYLNDGTILSIYEDRGNNLWFGSFQGGLNKMSKRKIKFRRYAREPGNPNSLSSDSVIYIEEDAEGILWIGTYSGLNRFDPKNQHFTHYRHDANDPASIGSNSIWALYCERPDLIWVGTGDRGIHCFNPETGTSTPFNTGIGSVTDIAEDSSGTLWIATWGNGVAKLDRETGKAHHYAITPGTPRKKELVTFIYEDKYKVLWFCTFGQGLVKVGKHGFQSFRYKEGDPTGISSDYLQGTAETESGDMWIGSTYGLNRFDRGTNTFTCFTEADGLCNNTIYGVVADGEDLWLSTNGGISQFNTRTLTFRNYDTGDGLQAMEFNQGAFYKTRGGEILFGGVNGLNAFFPNHVPTNPHVPPVVITRVTVFGRPVTLPNAVYAVDRVQLSYKDRFFAFEFAALDFENPGKNRYAYKLEGFNRDWVLCGSRRYVSFSNLTGGDYIFRVKGSNNDGAWNEQGAAVRISITLPPWQTWWFRFLAAVLAIGVIYLLFRFRIRHLKHKMEKEHLKNELKLKTDFTAMLVHDLRNPLQCILGYSELVADETDPAGIRRFSDRIKMSSATMLNLINDMLDISKFEAGKMVIHPEPTNLVDIINENLGLMEPLLERNQNRFVLHLEPLPPVKADVVRISQVINNLLANAVKFSPQGGVITVTAGTVRENDRQFQEITVTDQGPGIAPEKQAFIFSRYARVENISEAAAKGTGLGLAVSRLIVEAHQGTIGYRQAESGGSVFFFRVPGDPGEDEKLVTYS